MVVGCVPRMTWTIVPSWMLRAAADADPVHVAADDDVHPDAALLADLDVADDLGAVVHERRRVHDRKAPLIAPKHL